MKNKKEDIVEKKYVCPQCSGKVNITVPGEFIESYCPSCDRYVVAKVIVKK